MEDRRKRSNEDLQYEAEQISKDILARLEVLESGNGKSWARQNWFSIVSFLVIVCGIGAGWGRMETRISHYDEGRTEQAQAFHQSLVAITAEITAMQEQIRDHHEDVDRHVDANWKREVAQQLSEIRNLLIQHLNDTRRITRAP